MQSWGIAAARKPAALLYPLGTAERKRNPTIIHLAHKECWKEIGKPHARAQAAGWVFLRSGIADKSKNIRRYEINTAESLGWCGVVMHLLLQCWSQAEIKLPLAFALLSPQLCMLIPFPFVQSHRMRNDDVYALSSPQPTACRQVMVAMMSFDLMYSTYKKRASCELQR
jgi:hypothetical protein